MLIEMRLENYAVIDNLAVEFGHGLNLLTGETGAGKSILVDALALLLGEKASIDVIRTGAERAVVSAVFEAEGAAEKPLERILEANGLDESDDGTLILRREIAAGSKGRSQKSGCRWVTNGDSTTDDPAGMRKPPISSSLSAARTRE